MAEGRAGARSGWSSLLDDAPRYLNTALLMRLLCEIAAIVIVTQLVSDAYDGAFWPSLVTSIGVMALVSFVVIGVAPRTLGRQHSQRVALATAGPISSITRILGPIPRLLILLGNAITPGRGFREGPFSTETELRELVDLAEASAVIESGERKMIHSVFEFGDTIVREVMVPRGDVVYIERFKNLRQTMSLFLRSGFSRVPVVDDNLDEVVGHRLPQGHRAPRLRGTRRGVHPAHRRGDAARVVRARTPSGSTPCSRRCRPTVSTSRSSSTSTAAPPAWSPSRTCSRRSSARSPTSTTPSRSTS